MKKLLRFLHPYRWLASVAIVLVFVQAMAELYLPTLMASIVDEGIVQGDVGHIVTIGGRMLMMAALAILAAIVATRLASRVAMAFGRDLRNRLFTHVTNFSLQEFDKVGTSTLITRTTNDVTQVQQLVYMSLRMLTRAPLMAIGGIFMALSQDTGLSWVFVVVIPVLAAGMAIIAGKGMPLFKVMQEKLDRVNLVSREGLMGIRVIRAFNRTHYEEARFDDANRDLTQTAIRVNQIMAAMEPLMALTLSLTTVAILWFGGLRIDAGHMQVGNLMAFIQYATQIMFSLMMLSMMFVMIPRASVSANRIAEVLAMEPEIRDPEEPARPAQSRGVVEFNNVTFHYPGAEAPALSDITFTAKPGQLTAIVGGIGSGKSTLANLLLRFYDVTGGSIAVDGVDIRHQSQEELRSQVGYVPQRALLFSGSVAENLLYGKPGATEDELHKAAESAQAAGFVQELEHGFDAIIAQGGTNLSGGQRQRLTIARALVRRPRIYVFDDNFSALDFKTDAKVRAALRSETTDATVIIVAQRVSTIMDADQIIVLDAGQIAGIGTHRELVQTCNIYREIVASQLAEEAIA